MHQFVRARMAPRKVDAGDAAVVDLLEKLTQVGAPLVIDPGVGKETTAIAAFENAGGEIDVFAKAHLGKSFELHIDIAAYAHIERTRVELV